MLYSAAKPTVPIPTAERLRPPPPEQLPKICQQPTVTVCPGSLGKIYKFRQDRHCWSAGECQLGIVI